MITCGRCQLGDGEHVIDIVNGRCHVMEKLERFLLMKDTVLKTGS